MLLARFLESTERTDNYERAKFFKGAEKIYFKLKYVERKLLEQEETFSCNIGELSARRAKQEGQITSLRRDLCYKKERLLQANERLAVLETDYRELREGVNIEKARKSTRVKIFDIIGGFTALFVSPISLQLASSEEVSAAATEADRRINRAEMNISKQRSFIQEAKSQVSSLKYKIQMKAMECIFYKEEIITMKAKNDACLTQLHKVQEDIRFFEEVLTFLYYFFLFYSNGKKEETMLCITA